MRPAEVEAVYPGSEGAVGLGILALVVLQVAVLVHEVPEELTVALVGEVDFAVILGDVHQVGGVAVAVDVVRIDEAVAPAAIAGVEQAEVILMIFVADGGDHTVGDDVARVLQLHVVRAVHRVESRPSRSGVAARHAGSFLHHRVGVSGHQVEVLHRFGGSRQVKGPAVALVGVGQHAGVGEVVVAHLRVVAVVARIEVAVVGTLQALPSFVDGLDVIVVQDHGVHVLRVGELTGQGQREGHGELIVHGQRRLPHLRHLEVLVYAGHFGRHRSLVGRDVLRRAEQLADLVDVRHQSAGKVLQTRV